MYYAYFIQRFKEMYGCILRSNSRYHKYHQSLTILENDQFV